MSPLVTKVPQAHLQPRRADARTPWKLLWSTLAFTLLATWFVTAYSRKAERTLFERNAGVAGMEVQNRLETYVALLRSGVSLFAASQEVSADEFRKFVEGLRISALYPGIYGLGFSAAVPKEGRAAALEQIRRADPAIQFRPEIGPDEELHAILFLEPLHERNRGAIGYNMHSDPVRRVAMDAARDTGEPQASGTVRLVQEIEDTGQPGFLIYVPVYEKGNYPATTSDRRADLRGFVYGAFRVHDFFHEALRSFDQSRMAIEAFDGPVADPAKRIFASKPLDKVGRKLALQTRIDVAGRPWTLKFYGDPDLGLAEPYVFVPLVGGSGLLLALVLFFTTRAMTRAHAMANEKALEAARARQLFERIAEATPDILFVHDLPGHRNIFVNRAISQALGYSPEEMKELEAEWVQIVHPDDKERVLQHLLQLRELKNGELATTEARGVDKQGKHRWFLVRSLVFSRAENGEVLEVMGLATDITARRTTEEALRSANKAKDEFLATLSHELRTPLTPVLTIISTLERDRKLSDEVREELGMARRNVELEARLIDDLLDLTRIARGKLPLNLETLDMRELAAHTAASVVELTEKKIDFAIDWHADLRWVRGDRSRLSQLLWNLVKNAAKFTPSGNRVRLRARNEPHAQDGSQWLVMEVEDQGVGIDRENLSRIFNAFEQGGMGVTRKFGGLGLGLAISKAVTELHQGEIDAFSEGTGRGARFTVKLPALAEAPKPTAPAPEAPACQDTAGAGIRLLLVEDHRDTAVILTKRLRRLGYRVTHAASLAEGFAAARIAHDTGDQFDFVLSDLGLPDGTGYDLMRRLSELYGLRGIALSGFGMEADIRRSEEAGFLRHFTKPVDFELVRSALAEMLEPA